MKRIKALLLVMVLSVTCVAFSACSNDPKSLKGEEVNRLEWLEAFEYIANGISGEDKSASFTFTGTVKQYEKASNNDDDEKELQVTISYSMQVNRKVVYLEASMAYLYENETFEEKGYMYADNSGTEKVIYSSTDDVKWQEDSSSSIGLSTISSSINQLKNESLKFNKKTGMYEKFLPGEGYAKIKFYEGKIVYMTTITETTEAEFFFTDYDKTEIEKEKPKAEKNKLELAYNAVKNSGSYYTNVSLSEDGTYLDFTYYGGSNDEDFATINNILGLPNGSIVATMQETTTLNQRKKVKENGIIVTWVKKGENINNSNGGIYDVTYILE